MNGKKMCVKLRAEKKVRTKKMDARGRETELDQYIPVHLMKIENSNSFVVFER